MNIHAIKPQLNILQAVLDKAKDPNNLKIVFQGGTHASQFHTKITELSNAISEFQNIQNTQKLKTSFIDNLPDIVKRLFALYEREKYQLSENIQGIFAENYETLQAIQENLKAKENNTPSNAKQVELSTKETVINLADELRLKIDNPIPQLGNKIAKTVEQLFKKLTEKFSDEPDDKDNTYTAYICLRTITDLLSNILNEDTFTKLSKSLQPNLKELKSRSIDFKNHAARIISMQKIEQEAL